MKIVRCLLLSIALMASSAGVASAATSSNSTPDGASFLLAGGMSSDAINASAGNGIPGPRAALSVPEPPSWVAFALGALLIGGVATVRRRSLDEI